MYFTRRLSACLLIAALVVLALHAAGTAPAVHAQGPAGDLFNDVDDPTQFAAPDDPTIVRSRFVTVNFEELSTLRGQPEKAEQLQDTVQLNLFDDARLTFIIDSVNTTSFGSTMWQGRIEGESYSVVRLVVRDGVLIGNITLSDRFFRVRYAGGETHAIYELDITKFPREEEPLAVELPEKQVAPAEVSPLVDNGSTIDVLVVYSDDARAAAGSRSAIEGMIETAIDETNDAYANSNIAQRVRLVAMHEVSYSESQNLVTDVNRLQDPSDGFIDVVHDFRDAYAADLVTLIVNTITGNGCGRAFDILDPVSTSFANKAFNVTRRNCATAPQYSFPHELGHLMAARHDWYVDDSTSSPYSYNHGYVRPASSWRTIMAYNDECDCSNETTPCPAFNSRTSPGTPSCPRLENFSNPAVNSGGNATGVSSGTDTSCTAGNLSNPDCDADNESVLDKTASTVANFISGSLSPVYVDGSNTGTETGSSSNPYNTVTEGAFRAAAGANVWITPDSYPETLVTTGSRELIINRNVLLRSTGGSVVIGK